MANSSDQKLRKELLNYVKNAHTHANFSKAVADFPEEFMNKKFSDEAPHTAWMILEHICIATHDMIDFIQNPNYVELEWPDDFWPSEKEKADKNTWDESITAFETDIGSLVEILEDPKNDLLAKIAWGDGQTILRETLQIIDHTSYHIGQLIMLRRVLGIWKET